MKDKREIQKRREQKRFSRRLKQKIKHKHRDLRQIKIAKVKDTSKKDIVVSVKKHFLTKALEWWKK